MIHLSMQHFDIRQTGPLVSKIEEVIGNYPMTRFNKREGRRYADMPVAFDTEASSFVDTAGKKVGLLYIWQVCIGDGDIVVYGREMRECFEFFLILDAIAAKSDCQICVWVHNLQYDWQFIRKWFSWQKIFFTGNRKPVYADFKNLRFRDSLIMSGGRSLALIGRELHDHKIEKKVGDLDYSKIRTPFTPMSDTELGYCENDVRVLSAYIAEKIKEDGSLSNIPLTNTGYVRRALKEACFKDYEGYMNVLDTLVMSPAAYNAMKEVQAGGFTHGNRRYYGKVLKNVASYDIRSSYPAVMVYKYYPMSQPVKVDVKYATENFRRFLNEKCVMMKVEFTGLRPTLGNEFPLSLSKCIEISSGYSISNGRIVECDRCVVGLTELDYATFEDFYEWDSMSILEFWSMDRHRLPKAIVETILKYYKDKTELKGIPEKYLEYMIAKNMINAIFGCMCMDPVREEYVWDYDTNDFIMGEDGLPKLTEGIDVAASVEKENNKRGRFLFYGWGIWVTAHARRNLMRAIKSLGEDYVYSDTDSVKFLNPEKHRAWFDEYDKEIRQNIIDTATKLRIKDVRLFMPLKPGEGSIESRKQVLGTWDNEGVYSRFLTYGAKRYLTEKKNEYQITCAGLNKFRGTCHCCGLDWQAASDEIEERTGDPGYIHLSVPKDMARVDPFEYFHEDMTIPAYASGRMTMTYVDDVREGYVVDYLGKVYKYDIMSGVHAAPGEYTMGLAADVHDTVMMINRLVDDGMVVY